MILPEQIALIRRLLQEEGLSHRKIARRAGVSRGVVLRMATSERPNRGQPTVRPRRDYTSKAEVLPERCPTCGARVRPPCLRCWVARLRRERHLTSSPLPLEEPLSLELLYAHRERYDEVRAQHLAHLRDNPEPEEELR